MADDTIVRCLLSCLCALVIPTAVTIASEPTQICGAPNYDVRNLTARYYMYFSQRWWLPTVKRLELARQAGIARCVSQLYIPPIKNPSSLDLCCVWIFLSCLSFEVPHSICLRTVHVFILCVLTFLL